MPKRHEPDPIDVDDRQLDREWNAQPRLMHAAGVRLADARRDESVTKAKLELVEAELALAIRRTPERYGFPSAKPPSNDVVDAAVKVQKEYRLALQELIDAKHAADVASAEVSALAHKKSALENAVILYCRGYGAECKLPQEYEEEARNKLQRRGRWADSTRDVEE